MNFTPRADQEIAIEHILHNPYAALFVGLGMGKTINTLISLNELMHERKEVRKALVIAPKKVAESVWVTEGAKWEQTKRMTFSLVLGTEKQRKEALAAKADIYVINRENVAWLVAYYAGAWPFDALVIDELSSFKSAKSQRFKALRTIRPRCKRVLGLTGTPMPNSLLDLWPQLYLLDMGERLGKTITGYRTKYFKPGRGKGHIVYEYDLMKGDDLLGGDIYEKEIFDKIGDICISMKSKDWLTLPGMLDQDVYVTLPDDVLKRYNDFEKQQVLAIPDGEDITAVSAAALSMKLLQFANGAVYNDDKTYYEVHDEKLEALAEDLEAAGAEPYLLFYQFKHDLERILKKLKAYKPYVLKNDDDITRWNRGEIPFLLAHPASAGHGLNLQHGGHLMGWYGVNWNLEWYQQACGRLLRPGQTETVLNRRFITKGTIEERVIQALDDKDAAQDALLNAVKALRKKYLSTVK